MTPQESYLQDFAAYLFWNVAAEAGVAEALERFDSNEEDWTRKTHLIEKALEQAGRIQLVVATPSIRRCLWGDPQDG